MDQLPQLLNKLPFAAQLWNSQGEVVLTNPLFNRLFSLRDNFDWRLEGRTLLQDPQLLSQGLDDSFRSALSGKRVDAAAVRYTVPRQGDDENAPGDVDLKLFLTLVPLMDGTEGAYSVVCIVSDYAFTGVSMDKEMMRSQRMENVEVLASGVAHEFNNLFTGIRGLADLIKDCAEPGSEIVQFAEAIQQSITRGAELIAKLNSFARELPHALRRHHLGDYLENAQQVLRLQASKRVQFSIDVEVDSMVLLDTNRMDQALSNLVTNAKEAMGGTGTMLIRVLRGFPRAVPADEPAMPPWALLTVEDSGPGIPVEIQSRVLEPFFSTKERGKSTGLGMSMTHRIVTLHGGQMEIGTSARLGGACVCIYLPLADS